MKKYLKNLFPLVFTIFVLLGAYFYLDSVSDQRDLTEMASIQGHIEFMAGTELINGILPEYVDLYEQNQDIAGYIKIANTNVNYPVMKSNDNEHFYRNHGFSRKRSDWGLPYITNETNENGINGITIYGKAGSKDLIFKDLLKLENNYNNVIIEYSNLKENFQYKVVNALYLKDDIELPNNDYLILQTKHGGKYFTVIAEKIQ